MKAAAIYSRVSTSDQVKGTSLDGQVEACQEYAEQHGYTVLKAIQEDVSGARLDRVGLDQIRDMAVRSEIQAAIVYDPDRLTRNLGHLMLLVDEFERNHVELIFVNSPHENTPEGMMLLQMRGMFAQYERTKIQERCRRGKERRAKEGKVIASCFAPYGYAFIIGEGRFQIDPIESQWAIKIFNWYVKEGMSMRGIARRLNELGVPTKRGAQSWQPTTIRSILTNSAYKGQWFYNKSGAAVAKKRRFADGQKPKSIRSSQRRRPIEEWIGVEVPALVPPDVFDGVSVQMERNARHAKRNCKTDYLLRGLLICKQCGRRISARRSSPIGKNKTMYNQY